MKQSIQSSSSVIIQICPNILLYTSLYLLYCPRWGRLICLKVLLRVATPKPHNIPVRLHKWETPNYCLRVSRQSDSTTHSYTLEISLKDVNHASYSPGLFFGNHASYSSLHLFVCLSVFLFDWLFLCFPFSYP